MQIYKTVNNRSGHTHLLPARNQWEAFRRWMSLNPTPLRHPDTLTIVSSGCAFVDNVPELDLVGEAETRADSERAIMLDVNTTAVDIAATGVRYLKRGTDAGDSPLAGAIGYGQMLDLNWHSLRVADLILNTWRKQNG